MDANDALPDRIVVINYEPGASTPFPALPERNSSDGTPLNTLTGVCNWLLRQRSTAAQVKKKP